MKLNNSFVVPGDADAVFEVLLDLEQVAGCMPGARLTGHEGEEYHGGLKLRIGPITAEYAGTVTIKDVDRSDRAAVLYATGSEVSGQGGAEATITARVDPDGESSRVGIESDVAIRGKAAQFGRGALADVTQRILDQFAKNLEGILLGEDEAGSSGEQQATDSHSSAAGAPSTGGGQRSVTRPSPEEPDASLDLFSVVALPIARQWAPAVAAFVVGFAIGSARARRQQRVRVDWGEYDARQRPRAPHY